MRNSTYIIWETERNVKLNFNFYKGENYGCN